MIVRRAVLLLSTLAMLSCAHSSPPQEPTATGSPVQGVALPASGGKPVLMDYLAYDRAHHRIWVPAGNTARVDVIDTSSGELHQVEGFATAELERHGTKRTVGPSAATVGEGVVYVGNRGDSSVCEVSADSLKLGACVKLETMPDGLCYVASAHEVWVTTPPGKALIVLDTSQPGKLSVKAKIELDGEPEGYAVDDSRGLFYTNLEDKDRTLAIDVASRKTVHDWPAHCGEDGPKGLAFDGEKNVLFVACPSHVNAVDVGHDGASLSSLEAGDGIDNIDYVAGLKRLFIAGGKSATLTIAAVDDSGKLTKVSSVPTAKGARNAVATEQGQAYVADTPEAKILVVPPAP
jgi:hypothetical protein